MNKGMLHNVHMSSAPPILRVHSLQMSSPKHDDGRVDSRFENYSRFWEKVLTKEAQVDLDNRIENYTDIVNGACSLTIRMCWHWPTHSPT
jgi:hypothetical protein